VHDEFAAATSRRHEGLAKRLAAAARQRAYRRRRWLGVVLLRLEIGVDEISALARAGFLDELGPAAIARAVTRLLQDFTATPRD